MAGVVGFTFVLITGCDSDPDPVESCDRPHADCAALCADLCTRLAECVMPGMESCTVACERTYICAGETPGQDATICRNRAQASQSLSCAELCAEASFGQVCPP